MVSKALLRDRLIIYLNVHARVSLPLLKEREKSQTVRKRQWSCSANTLLPWAVCRLSAWCSDTAISEVRLGDLLPLEHDMAGPFTAHSAALPRSAAPRHLPRVGKPHSEWSTQMETKQPPKQVLNCSLRRAPAF